MPQKTSLFQLLPWIGGLNTSLDPSMISPHQLTVADNLIFDTKGSRRKRDGIKSNWDSNSNSSASVLGTHDFWYGASTKTQRIIGVFSDGKVYSYNAGTATLLVDAGTAWSGTLTTVSMCTYNNKCIIAVSGAGNVVKMYDGTTLTDLPGTPPQASLCGEHQGRLFLNDKTNVDRLFYSPAFDHTVWGGTGDSGAIDIGIGDGDPDGINCFFSFFEKNNNISSLVVWKRTKTRVVTGTNPDEYIVKKISNGVGAAGPNCATETDDDIIWVSERGVHSMAELLSKGDDSDYFLSADIQKTFNDSLSRSSLKYCFSRYLPQINSVAFALASNGSASNDNIYFYNIHFKAWFRWTGVVAQSICVANDADKKRFYFGSATGRVAKSFNGTNYDISSAGVNTAINFHIKTGIIFPKSSVMASEEKYKSESQPYIMNGFKRFILYYRPTGTHQIAVTIKIDNQVVDTLTNSFSFSQIGATDVLGSTFILGTSLLGYQQVLGPSSMTMDGYGRGFQVDITQSGIDQAVDIQGIGVEYEPSGPGSEVFLRSAA